MEERNFLAWHEGDMARMERANKRLWIVIIILIVALIGSNAGWLYYENSFEDVTVEQEVDTGMGDAYVHGVGDIYYGENQTESESP